MKIYIPTYKRADSLAGKDYFKTAVYVLPESQRDDYRRRLDSKRMIVIPDDQDGNIARKRNWILRNLDRPLLMIDDDVSNLTTTEGVYSHAGEFLQTKQSIKLSPEQAENVIVNGFNLANEFACVFWGINVNTDGRNYQQYKPISLTYVVLGPFQGHLEHNIFNDERMGTKDDYDFSLQVLNKYKKILRLNKYSYQCLHGDNPGGIVSQRTMDVEIKYCNAIMDKWGDTIIRYKIPPTKMADVLNGVVNVPIRGV